MMSKENKLVCDISFIARMVLKEGHVIYDAPIKLQTTKC